MFLQFWFNNRKEAMSTWLSTFKDFSTICWSPGLLSRSSMICEYVIMKLKNQQMTHLLFLLYKTRWTHRDVFIAFCFRKMPKFSSGVLYFHTKCRGTTVFCTMSILENTWQDIYLSTLKYLGNYYFLWILDYDL